MAGGQAVLSEKCMFSQPPYDDFKFLGKSKMDAMVATIVGDVTGLLQPYHPSLYPLLSWVLESSSLDSFTANKIILSRVSC